MAVQHFSHSQYSITALIENIDSGELSLPDLQRPFIWKRSRVRDLFDSLYHGYPAGYFLFWSTPSYVDSHRVATSQGTSKGLKMIVDGQQRLTSLYAVMKAREVVTAKNELQLIRISFNPLTEEFAVADAAHENDPEWLTSISEIWTSPDGVWAFTKGFISQLAAARELVEEEEDQIGSSLGKLEGLKRIISSRRWSFLLSSTLPRLQRSSSVSTRRAYL